MDLLVGCPCCQATLSYEEFLHHYEECLPKHNLVHVPCGKVVDECVCQDAELNKETDWGED